MSSCRLLHQCPACLVRLISIVFVWVAAPNKAAADPYSNTKMFFFFFSLLVTKKRIFEFVQWINTEETGKKHVGLAIVYVRSYSPRDSQNQNQNHNNSIITRKKKVRQILLPKKKSYGTAHGIIVWCLIDLLELQSVRKLTRIKTILRKLSKKSTNASINKVHSYVNYLRLFWQ